MEIIPFIDGVAFRVLPYPESIVAIFFVIGASGSDVKSRSQGEPDKVMFRYAPELARLDLEADIKITTGTPNRPKRRAPRRPSKRLIAPSVGAFQPQHYIVHKLATGCVFWRQEFLKLKISTDGTFVIFQEPEIEFFRFPRI